MVGEASRVSAGPLGRIAQILRVRSPQLHPKAAEDVAAVLLHNMKTMKALTLGPGTAAGSGVVAELREMNRLYLEHKLSRDESENDRVRREVADAAPLSPLGGGLHRMGLDEQRRLIRECRLVRFGPTTRMAPA